MYSIETIESLIGARHYGGSGGPIGWLLTDSRSLCFPQETLFFALSSNRNDGHNYIPDLYRRGVRCFVVETLPKAYQGKLPGACFLKVQSSLKALQRLSERHREEFDIPIIGITGSNGKTMVKEWLYQILSPDITITRSPRSYNSQIGVPLSVWLLNDQTQIGIFEAGISQKNEMASLRAIIQPTMCVLTNIGTTHQENFSSLEEKCHEKLHLISDSKQVVYPYDDQVIRKCIFESDYKGELITWSKISKDVTLFVTSIKKQEAQTTISFEYKNQKGEYTLPFIDDASIANSITVATVALSLGMKIEKLAQRMKILEPVAMRLEVKEGQKGCILINDSYNSDVNSLDIALDFMNRRSRNKERKHTLILSDIYQSGKDSKALYSDVSDLLLKRGVDKLIGIGKEISLQSQVFNVKEKYFFETTEDFILSQVYSSLSNEVILLKGSRKFNFDYLTQLLQYKVHQTILEVNLKALIENLNYFRSFLK
ncbi:MAG: bifunctional UDP-N-acetylmuramoyl-tripeptide:D-alanyl-D-alanine ligase/alanine racemase, partial [Prevotella sp.]|nr:bifunctional UDP-N-acetylmuramoyl-tripeptide:D-alanyl-D-alanine ligase/alanine racemase [Prevotella sp.]